MSAICLPVKLFRLHGMVSSFLFVVWPFPRLMQPGPFQPLLSLINCQHSSSPLLVTHHLCAFRPSALILDAFLSHIWELTRDGSACVTVPSTTSSAVSVRAPPPVTFLTSTIRLTEPHSVSRSQNSPTSLASSFMSESNCLEINLNRATLAPYLI